MASKNAEGKKARRRGREDEADGGRVMEVEY